MRMIIVFVKAKGNVIFPVGSFSTSVMPFDETGGVLLITNNNTTLSAVTTEGKSR